MHYAQEEIAESGCTMILRFLEISGFSSMDEVKIFESGDQRWTFEIISLKENNTCFFPHVFIAAGFGSLSGGGGQAWDRC